MAPWPHMPGFQVPSPLANANAATVLMGQPVYSSGAGLFNLAIASAVATGRVIGVVAVASIAPNVIGPYQDDGTVMQLTSLWDAICGTSGGLSPDVVYYLSPTTAGMLTSVAPTTRGQVVMPVLIGLSPTQAQVALGPLVLL